MEHPPPACCPVPGANERTSRQRGLVPWSLLRFLMLGLGGATVLLGALALRSIPLLSQLGSRSELAQAKPPPALAAAEKLPAELPFRCC